MLNHQRPQRRRRPIFIVGVVGAVDTDPSVVLVSAVVPVRLPRRRRLSVLDRSLRYGRGTGEQTDRGKLCRFHGRPLTTFSLVTLVLR